MVSHAHQREEGTACHQRPQQAHKEPENTRRGRGRQHRRTKPGMRGAHTPERTPRPQNTHTTNPSTRRTRGMRGARCPHTRKYGQRKVWQEASTRHSNVLVLVNKPSRLTCLTPNLPTRTLCSSPTPWMWSGRIGKPPHRHRNTKHRRPQTLRNGAWYEGLTCTGPHSAAAKRGTPQTQAQEEQEVCPVRTGAQV